MLSTSAGLASETRPGRGQRAVLVTDHATEACAGGPEVVLKGLDSVLELTVLGPRSAGIRSEAVVLAGQLRESFLKVAALQLVDLTAKLETHAFTQADVTPGAGVLLDVTPECLNTDQPTQAQAIQWKALAFSEAHC